MKRWTSLLVVGALVGCLLLAGCKLVWPRHARVYVVPPPVLVTDGPPEPLVEVIPPLPGLGYVWITGYWHWQEHEHHWAWQRGRYEPRPHPGAEWRPPDYRREGNRWHYAPGHWTEPPARTYVVPPPLIVTAGPPAPLAEVIPRLPGPNYIWIAGYWHWPENQHRWVWQRGHYELRPHPGAEWQPPEYQRQGNRWHYAPGHWRDAPPQREAPPRRDAPPRPR